jgi:hypothetical protein
MAGTGRRGRLTLAIACLLTIVGCGREPPAGTGSMTSGERDGQEAAVAAIAETWIARYNAGDAAAVASLCTSDGYYASAHVLAHGRDQIRQYWDRGIAAGGHVDFIRPVENLRPW